MNEGISNVTVEEATAGIEDRFLELMEKGSNGIRCKAGYTRRNDAMA